VLRYPSDLLTTVSSRDRKKKRFVGQSGNQGNNKKIKTESGQWINASYKSDAYGVSYASLLMCIASCYGDVYS